VVTGGSEGLGLELCYQLAEQGFNICMVSRNQVKIDQRLQEISARFPDRQYRGVQADLASMTTVAQYRDLINTKMSGMDVGVLCLNAGCWVEGPMDLISDEDFEREIGLNAVHVVHMTKAFLT